MSHTEYKTSIVNSIDLKGFTLMYEDVKYKVKKGEIEQSAITQIFTEANTSRRAGRSNTFTLQLVEPNILKLNSISNIQLTNKKETYTGVITYSDSTGLVKGIIT